MSSYLLGFLTGQITFRLFSCYANFIMQTICHLISSVRKRTCDVVGLHHCHDRKCFPHVCTKSLFASAFMVMSIGWLILPLPLGFPFKIYAFIYLFLLAAFLRSSGGFLLIALVQTTIYFDGSGTSWPESYLLQNSTFAHWHLGWLCQFWKSVIFSLLLQNVLNNN